MTTPGMVRLPAAAVARLAVLLEHCHTFLDANEAAQAELRAYCATQPYGVTTFGLIEQLAWEALLLRIYLREQTAGGGGRDREGV